MNTETAKAKLKRLTDGAIGIGASHIEASLEPGEYYIYTDTWQLSMEQIDRIRKEVTITTISVDGGSIMLIAKI